MPKINLPLTYGSASNDSLARSGYGRERSTVIAEHVAATLAMVRRTFPDVPLDRLVVDLTDMPGAHSVKWAIHTGDHVPSAFDAHNTHRRPAADYLGV